MYVRPSRVALALLCALIAGCSGGGGSATPPIANSGSSPAAKADAVFSITIPNAVQPQYVSASTKSVYIEQDLSDGTVLNSGITNLTPSSPNCTPGTGGLTCTATIAADVGFISTFVVKTYDGLNATGNILSTGSVPGTVKVGVANSFPLTLGGTIASVSLVVGDLYPSVGTSTTVGVQAKDAGGNTIVGTYDSPVTLSVPSGTSTLTTSSFSNSSGSSTLTLTNSQTAAFALSAAANGKSGTATITPSSGFIGYPLGGGANDVGGLHVTAGVDGKLYYTTGGAGFGTSAGATTGNIGQFDPATGNFTEIASSAFPFSATQTNDGTVWVATTGGPAKMARITGTFSQANYSEITLPLPGPSSNPEPRSMTSGSGIMYLTSNQNYIWKMPIAGPYTTAAVSIVAMPSPGPNQPRMQGIAPDNSGNVWVANDAVNAGASDIKYTPSSGALANFFTFPFGQNAHPRYMALAGDGFVYQTGVFGGCTTNSATPCGAVNQLSAGCATGICANSLGTVDNQSMPDDVAAGSAAVVYTDLWWEGLGIRATGTGNALEIPIAVNPYSATNFGMAPEGVTIASDGTIWFITFVQQANGKLAMERAVFTSAWSIWPGKSLTLGPNSNMLVGIMEPPDKSSGPFTAANSNPNVCGIQGTNFPRSARIVSLAVGTCAITITDAHGRSDTVNVTVTTTTPAAAAGRAEL
ncbi:MAG TPA: hypothetical protein VFW34_07970 [Candidatus Rubrimentiphilum sp.]|nr:hypothetical protein [Candidatus Rubrimentiphilum sp.]